MNPGKALPWLLTVLLLVAAGVLWASGKQKDEVIAEQTGEIQRLTSEYNELVKDANEKIAYANLPIVPVEATPIKPLFSDGFALQIQNKSDKTIAIKVVVERPADKKTMGFERTIDSLATKTIDKSDGWAFIDGDKVTITQADHKPQAFTILEK
jgi:hypothetical protein